LTVNKRSVIQITSRTMTQIGNQFERLFQWKHLPIKTERHGNAVAVNRNEKNYP